MLLKPKALRSGDRIAIVAPASPFAREEFDAGVAELRGLGFEPVYSENVFARDLYLAGSADVRARDLLDAWTDPGVAGIIAARGGYGSVHLLPLLNAEAFRRLPKAFIGYSDNTSLLTWLMQTCGMVTFHGPMVEGRFARGVTGYDRDTFVRCLCRAEPLGELAPPQLESLAPGEAAGELVGGTLTQLVASLGTPFAFDPPAGCVLFLDEVTERPYRLDRMLTQLRSSGLLVRVAAIVFNELPRCDEPGGTPTARDAVRMVLKDFPGPILFGLPSGHSDGPTMTLPFGVSARVIARSRPALVIEEAAVS
ncbi:MAG: S66 peptidase family protein [Vicinamibacterales bacterium]